MSMFQGNQESQLRSQKGSLEVQAEQVERALKAAIEGRDKATAQLEAVMGSIEKERELQEVCGLYLL